MTFKLAIRLGATVLSWVALSALAQTSNEREAEVHGAGRAFMFRVWDAAEGLLPTYVRDVAQTPDGYVWLVANEGLVRFDGVRSVTFSG